MPMRRLLPLFMILLLTLRGLLGDAMAMGSLPNAGDHMPTAVAAAQTAPQAQPPRNGHDGRCPCACCRDPGTAL